MFINETQAFPKHLGFLYFYFMRITIVLAIAFLFFTSCRNTDEVAPTLSVTSPYNMMSVNYGDIITVSGSATDDQNLKSVKIELLYDNLAATDFSYELTTNNNTFEFNKSFELDDRHMGTATYLLKVSAIDKAGNRKTEFIELNYGELPKELQGIAIVNKVSASIYDLYYYDLNSVSFIKSFVGDFQSLLADAYHLLIWMSGGTSGDLVAYDLENDVVSWSQSPQLSFFPFFGELHQMSSDYNVAMVKGNSTAVSMDSDGMVNRTYTLNNSAEGGEIFEIKNYVIIEEIYSNNHYLSVFNKGTGNRVHQTLMSEDVIAIKKRNNDEVFVITSTNNSSHLYQYDYKGNSLYEPHSIDPGTLYDLCVIDQDEIILAHSNGLMRFTLDNNSMVTVNTDIALQLEYDDLSGIIYANVNNSLKIFDHLGNSGGSITSGVNVSSFSLYYNK